MDNEHVLRMVDLLTKSLQEDLAKGDIERAQFHVKLIQILVSQ